MRTATIITNETRELVAAVEHSFIDQLDATPDLTRQLIGQLTIRCEDPQVQEKYAQYTCQGEGLGKYPISSNGFAHSFDVLDEECDFYEHWSRLGIVVGKSVASANLCAAAVSRIKEITLNLSSGSCNIDVPDTYGNLPVDEDDVPILTRGFFEIYHDDSLAQLRQSLRTYLHHVVLWGKADLWTTFDRFGVKLPGHQESVALPLHVDQNPKQHPDFRTIQGVLALEDCPVERGTLRAVPGSKALFSDYLPISPECGEYVELDTELHIADQLTKHAQPIPLRQGDLVSWDSRTTHANTANISELPRFVALIAAGVAREDDTTAIIARNYAFETGLGSNVRDAYMHASKKPRYTDQTAISSVRAPERLNVLGKLLYGQERYAS